jgi:hypothetical protein
MEQTTALIYSQVIIDKRESTRKNTRETFQDRVRIFLDMNRKVQTTKADIDN